MREFADGDRMFGNEFTSAATDAFQGTLVLDGCEVSDFESDIYEVTSGTVSFDGELQSISSQQEQVTLPPNLEGTTGYRYDTISLDGNGNLTVTQGSQGTLNDPDDPDPEESNFVGAPPRPEGHVHLATSRILEDGIDELFDGRALLSNLPLDTLQDRFIPFLTWGRVADTTLSQSGDTFTGDEEYIREVIRFNDYYESWEDVAVLVHASTGETMNADLEIRLASATAQDVIFEETISESAETRFSIGPITADPSGRSSLHEWEIQARSSSPENTVTVRELTVVWGYLGV